MADFDHERLRAQLAVVARWLQPQPSAAESGPERAALDSASAQPAAAAPEPARVARETAPEVGPSPRAADVPSPAQQQPLAAFSGSVRLRRSPDLPLTAAEGVRANEPRPWPVAAQACDTLPPPAATAGAQPAQFSRMQPLAADGSAPASPRSGPAPTVPFSGASWRRSASADPRSASVSAARASAAQPSAAWPKPTPGPRAVTRLELTSTRPQHAAAAARLPRPEEVPALPLAAPQPEISQARDCMLARADSMLALEAIDDIEEALADRLESAALELGVQLP